MWGAVKVCRLCPACLHVNQFVENLVSCSLRCELYFYYGEKISSFQCYIYMKLLWLFLDCFSVENISSNPDQVEYYLHPTDDGKSSEETHGATHCGQHVFKLSSSVLADPVKCGSVEKDLDKLKLRLVVKFCKKNVLNKYF